MKYVDKIIGAYNVYLYFPEEEAYDALQTFYSYLPKFLPEWPSYKWI